LGPFWICIHYNGPNEESRVIPKFERWNYEDTEELAKLKKGTLNREGDFTKTAEENFTLYYRPLIPWANRLRKAVFPDGGRWKQEDEGLYSQMKAVLKKGREDPAGLRVTPLGSAFEPLGILNRLPGISNRT